MLTLQPKDLLDTVARAGIHLTLTTDSGLKVTPASILTSELRDTIKVNRDALVAYLQQVAANGPSEVECELFEERMAILEFDGGIDSLHAEGIALLHTDYVMHHWPCKTCCAAGIRRGQRCNLGEMLWAKYETASATKPSLSAGDSQTPPSSL